MGEAGKAKSSDAPQPASQPLLGSSLGSMPNKFTPALKRLHQLLHVFGGDTLTREATAAFSDLKWPCQAAGIPSLLDSLLSLAANISSTVFTSGVWSPKGTCLELKE